MADCNGFQISELPGSNVSCNTIDIRTCLKLAGQDITHLIGNTVTDGVTVQGVGTDADPIALKAVFANGTLGDGTPGNPLIPVSLLGVGGGVDTNTAGVTVTSADGQAVSVQAQNGVLALVGATVTIANAGTGSFGGIVIGDIGQYTTIKGGDSVSGRPALNVDNLDTTGTTGGLVLSASAGGVLNIPLFGFNKAGHVCADVIGYDGDALRGSNAIVNGITLAPRASSAGSTGVNAPRVGIRSGPGGGVGVLIAEFCGEGSVLSTQLTMNPSYPNDSILHLNNQDSTGFSGLDAHALGGGPTRIAVGWGNSAVPLVHMRSVPYVYTFDPLKFTDDTGVAHVFGNATSAHGTYHEMFGGSSAGVSSAGAARIRYNEGTGKIQVSLNGGAYVDIVTL